MDQLPAGLQDEFMRGITVAIGVWIAAVTAFLVIAVVGIGIAALVGRVADRRKDGGP